jgi:ABC-type Mn2+/Zn2+ transport system permease subunit
MTTANHIAIRELLLAVARLIGMISVGAGMAFSFIWNTPTGPSSVVCAAGWFVASQVVHSVKK